MSDIATTTDLLARVEALTALIDGKAAQLADQRVALERLTAHSAARVPAQPAIDAREPKVGRRTLLTKVLGATAAAAVLTVAKEAATAQAATRTTVLTGTGSTNKYGLAASPNDSQGVVDPTTHIGNVTNQSPRYGVIGVESNPGFAPPDGAGVLGQAIGYYGVIGLSSTGRGVHGASRSNIGVAGVSTSSTGVRGDSGDGNGVFGVSTNASGVYGFSNFSYGTAGVSNSYTGVYARSGSHWGLLAESASSFAAVFAGPVYIAGSYTATGAKSAAVKNRRGEHRRMYCQESPDAWFEDFGEAKLDGGRAVVTLDPEFDDVVKGDIYHVFLTEYGDLGGLYVADRAPHRFVVRSRSGATGPFAYRVVARRLDDVGRRLEKIDVPDFSKAKRPVPPADTPASPERPGR